MISIEKEAEIKDDQTNRSKQNIDGLSVVDSKIDTGGDKVPESQKQEIVPISSVVVPMSLEKSISIRINKLAVKSGSQPTENSGTEDEKEDDDEEPEVPKRKRGRPSKKGQKPEDKDQITTKRKRGRPLKSQKVLTEDKENLQNTSDESTDEESEAVGPAVPKKGRGRPSKESKKVLTKDRKWPVSKRKRGRSSKESRKLSPEDKQHVVSKPKKSRPSKGNKNVLPGDKKFSPTKVFNYERDSYGLREKDKNKSQSYIHEIETSSDESADEETEVEERAVPNRGRGRPSKEQITTKRKRGRTSKKTRPSKGSQKVLSGDEEYLERASDESSSEESEVEEVLPGHKEYIESASDESTSDESFESESEVEEPAVSKRTGRGRPLKVEEIQKVLPGDKEFFPRKVFNYGCRNSYALRDEVISQSYNDETETSSDESTDDENEVEKPALPKGRGRPRKPLAEDKVQIKTKRKVGRPSKEKVEDQENLQNTSDESADEENEVEEPTVPKRERGRPSKESQKLLQEDQEQITPKRKRGRPSNKDLKVEDQEDMKNTSDKSADEESEVEEHAVPKRKRGRPAKESQKPLPEDKEYISSDDQTPDESINAHNSGPKRISDECKSPALSDENIEINETEEKVVVGVKESNVSNSGDATAENISASQHSES